MPIAKDRLYIDQIKQRFKDARSLKTSDIVKFYRAFEPQLKNTTINWRIYSLVQRGVLTRIGRGKFSFDAGRYFIPHISNNLKTIYSKLKKKFPFLEICIWNSSALNEFMVHQPVRFYILVEVEKEAVRSVFFFLKESKYPVYIEPTTDLMEKYSPHDQETIIVKPIVSEAPLQETEGINTVTLEKMLVDTFCDKVVFAAQHGAEMRNVFTVAKNKYLINEARLFRYANRRNKRKDLKEFYNSIL